MSGPTSAYVRASVAFFVAGTAVLGYLEQVLGSRALSLVIGKRSVRAGIFTITMC